MGIKGASILCAHKPFDLVKGMVIDTMQCVPGHHEQNTYSAMV